jgi:hypothetical protein
MHQASWTHAIQMSERAQFYPAGFKTDYFSQDGMRGLRVDNPADITYGGIQAISFQQVPGKLNYFAVPAMEGVDIEIEKFPTPKFEIVVSLHLLHQVRRADRGC